MVNESQNTQAVWIYLKKCDFFSQVSHGKPVTSSPQKNKKQSMTYISRQMEKVITEIMA